MQAYYCFLVRVITIVHLGVYLVNTISIPFIMYKTPFYIWMPMLTMMVSPVLGGTYCMFNRLENYVRVKAGMPTRTDVFESVVYCFEVLIKKIKGE